MNITGLSCNIIFTEIAKISSVTITIIIVSVTKIIIIVSVTITIITHSVTIMEEMCSVTTYSVFNKSNVFVVSVHHMYVIYTSRKIKYKKLHKSDTNVTNM